MLQNVILVCLFVLARARWVDFVDKFLYANHTLWDFENGTYRCISHFRQHTCAQMSMKNLDFVVMQKPHAMFPGIRADNAVRMWLRNDCDIRNCCYYQLPSKQKHCTEFTGAQFISKGAYGFGLYVFMGHITLSQLEAPAAFCFSLRDRWKEEKMEISMCFSSLASNVIRLKFKQGEKVWSQRALMGNFDWWKNSMLYTIDYGPKHIEWLINDIVLGELKASRPFPAGRMKLKLAILPLPTDEGYIEDSVSQVVILYSTGWRPPPRDDQAPRGVLQSHEELFVLHEHADLSTLTIALLVMIIVLILIYISCRNADEADQYCSLE